MQKSCDLPSRPSGFSRRDPANQDLQAELPERFLPLDLGRHRSVEASHLHVLRVAGGGSWQASFLEPGARYRRTAGIHGACCAEVQGSLGPQPKPLRSADGSALHASSCMHRLHEALPPGSCAAHSIPWSPLLQVASAAGRLCSLAGQDTEARQSRQEQ